MGGTPEQKLPKRKGVSQRKGKTDHATMAYLGWSWREWAKVIRELENKPQKSNLGHIHTPLFSGYCTIEKQGCLLHPKIRYPNSISEYCQRRTVLMFPLFFLARTLGRDDIKIRGQWGKLCRELKKQRANKGEVRQRVRTRSSGDG